MKLISPHHFLTRVTAKISLHHGTTDESVPYAWSISYCQTMKRSGKDISCYGYNGAPHLFGRGSRTDTLFQVRVKTFFDESL